MTISVEKPEPAPAAVSADSEVHLQRQNRFLRVAVLVLAVATLGLGAVVLYGMVADDGSATDADIDALLDDLATATEQRDVELYRSIVTDDFTFAKDLYFGGDMNASIALSGQVAGRIETVRPVKDVISETVSDFFDTIDGLSRHYKRES